MTEIRNSDWLASTPISLAAGHKWGFAGDSITEGTGAANTIFAYPYQSCIQAGFAGNRPATLGGVGGNTIAQIAARVDDIIATGITGLVVMGGTNDSGSSWRTTPEAYQATLTSIILKARAASIPCIVNTIPPIGSEAEDPVTHRLNAAYNAIIRTVIADTGAYIADVHKAMVDPATGYMRAEYDSGDGIHPSSHGHFVIGQAVAAAMARVRAPATLVDALDLSDAACIANPLMAGAIGPDSAPAGWYAFTPTGAISLAIGAKPESFAAGQCFEVEADGTSGPASNVLGYQLTADNYSIGDKLAMTCRYEIEDVAGNWVASNAADPFASGVSVSLNSGGANLSPTWPSTSALIVPPSWGVYEAPDTNLNIWLAVNALDGQHIKVRLGELQVFNLTKMGVEEILT